jgi:multisubunit Na+/H+ antiporter MnhB subunit
MKLAIAIVAAIVVIAVNLVLIYLAHRGYKKEKEWFPLLLAIIALPVVVAFMGMIVYANL